MQLITIASAAFFAATALAGTPYAKIYNKCSYPVSLWSVTADGSSDKKTLPANNGSYEETYQTPSVGGVSLKLSTTGEVTGQITQFEYTYEPSKFIWYDISNVNCVDSNCPFAKDGLYMESGKDCPTRSCTAGLTKCDGAYNAYNDDWNSLSCDPTADIELYLCASSASNSTTSATSTTGQASKREEAPAHRHKHRHPHWRH